MRKALGTILTIVLLLTAPAFAKGDHARRHSDRPHHTDKTDQRGYWTGR